MKEWLEPNYHKVIAIVVALVCIFFGVKNILKANGFSESFPEPEKNVRKQMPVADTTGLTSSMRLLTDKTSSETQWKTKPIAVRGGLTKEVPLFVSVRIVLHANQLIDMSDPTAPKLRPPVDNKWLTDNGLQYLSASVLKNDPDRDGYSNLEEWEEQTSPIDPSSHPPYTDKLYFIGMKTRFHRITFKADNAPDFAIREESREIGRKDGFYKVGDTLPSGRFKIEAYEKKEGVSPIGVPIKASELTLLEVATGEKFVIVLRVEHDRPELFAEFDFQLDTREPFFVQEGQSQRQFAGNPNPEPFSLGENSTVIYQLIKVTENEAVIAPKDNLEQTITISQGSVPLQDEEGNLADDQIDPSNGSNPFAPSTSTDTTPPVTTPPVTTPEPVDDDTEPIGQ